MGQKSAIQFVLGGSRSGKSGLAEKLAMASFRPVTYVATYKTGLMDSEMEIRIERHRQQRPCHWKLIENNFDLSSIAVECTGQTVLIDCLTLWLSNAMESQSTESVLLELKTGMEQLIEKDIHTIVVSNEIGMGLIPLGAENRRYRDLVGWANQQTAKMSKDVYFLVAGIPLKIKSNYVQCDLPIEA